MTDILKLIEAIKNRKRVKLAYFKKEYIVEVYTHGIGSNGKEYLRVWDIEDGKWKLFLLENIEKFEVLQEAYSYIRTGYNRNDKFFKYIMIRQ
jgi:predicted DNA-binding transcriptional regulator YafY